MPYRIPDFALDGFAAAGKTMISFLADIKKATGVILSELDMGGGLGINTYRKIILLKLKTWFKQWFGLYKWLVQLTISQYTPPVSF